MNKWTRYMCTIFSYELMYGLWRSFWFMFCALRLWFFGNFILFAITIS